MIQNCIVFNKANIKQGLYLSIYQQVLQDCHSFHAPWHPKAICVHFHDKCAEIV